MNDLPDALDIDDDGYPSEDRLQQIREGDGAKNGATWLVEIFPRLAASLPYAYCSVEDGTDFLEEPETRIKFSTGGWSGCEDFIEAVLGNITIAALYYHSWERGGHYEFRVPKK